MDQAYRRKDSPPVLLASRRPIFDRRQRVWAYELRLNSPGGESLSWLERFRSDKDSAEGEQTQDVLQSLTGNKRGLVEMSVGEILLGAAELLPENWLVRPLAGLSEPNPRLHDALKAIKESGRGIVLGTALGKADEALAELADVLAENYAAQIPAPPPSDVARSGRSRLALKVDTPEQFCLAKEQGFKYFQGQFYVRPQVEEEEKPLPAFRTNQLRLLQEIHVPEMRFGRLEEIISNDVSLAYDLLRYINSPFFSLRVTVSSIKQALALLGEEEVRKWISVVVLTRASEGKPHELAVLSLVRALFFSEAGRLAGLGARSGDLFMAGLFSLLDAFFDRPLAHVLKGIPLDKDIVAALLGSRTLLSGVVDLALAYEANEWPEVNRAAIELNMDPRKLLKCYHQAVTGAREFFREQPA